MAQIVFGMAIPHSGMQGKPGDNWLEDGGRDRNNPELWYRNRTWTYPELEAERIGEGFAAYLTLEERRTRSARCLAAIAELRRAYEAAKVDIAVIIGKDQKEIFVDLTPSIAVYTGAEIFNGPPQRAVYAPDTRVTHGAYPALAAHLVDAFEKDSFDIADLIKWPPNQWMKGEPIVPHAFGFVYRQIMGDNPPPHVPILMNTFYPPVQPSMSRSIALGHSLLAAIKSWDSDKRVAVIASGGLSHFVCDEEFDRSIIGHLEAFDFDALAKVDNRSYQSGTSEIKLYAAMLVGMKAVGAKMTLVDYVPCYRTEAGTGEGMGYMHWTLDR
jgi:3-O-methylgallate 3,4-dioxygenase